MTQHHRKGHLALLPCTGSREHTPPSWIAFSSHTPPGLPAEFQATHLARLLAPPPEQTQGFLSPRGQQCKAADGKLRVFNFLMRIVDLENSCYPRGHNTVWFSCAFTISVLSSAISHKPETCCDSAHLTSTSLDAQRLSTGDFCFKSQWKRIDYRVTYTMMVMARILGSKDNQA